MEVHILCFGITNDIVGVRHLLWQIPSGTTLFQLKEDLIQSYPELEKLPALQFAVNNQVMDLEYQLQENDEIVLIPPVAGG